ncbi:MAG: sugar-binding domain-containing protein, partial [Candidatus Aminicenantales bacterium]
MAIPRRKALGSGAGLVFILFVFAPVLSGQTSVDLSGSWRFDMDRADAGMAEHWFEKTLSGAIRLPGSMAGNGLGDDIAPNSPWTGTIINRSWLDDPANAPYLEPGNVKVPFWLNPVKIYVGPAWYQRDITVPEFWKGRCVCLLLERAHWETRLWVDGREIGTRDSLAVPHVYDLTAVLPPGPHTLTMRIDNRIRKINVGENAHSVTDHTQTNWNGVVGRIALVSGPMVYLDDVRIVPDVASRTANITAVIRNLTGAPARGTLNLRAQTVIGLLHRVGPLSVPFAAEGEETRLEIPYSLGAEAPLWDEFDLSLFELSAELRTETGERLEARVVRFGLRDFRADGTRFANNGRPVFLRGTVDCAVFPRTGYPPTQKRDWIRTFKIFKEYGLNHVRFHSWCPPEAAFDAADEAGMFLYVECGAWAKIGDGAPIDAWLYAESERIVRAYGNHPSFVMMSYGNEPDGDKADAFLAAFVSFWKAKDPRRIYTSAAGWPFLRENDFHLSPEPRLRHWGEGLNNRLDRLPPETAFDFRNVIAPWKVPVIGHEVGQWCAYPDFGEIPKFSGVLRPGNFEIFRDSLAAAGLADMADDFVNASGRLQILCYKADIEAALRTPGFAGFELLGLNDFPGQGTAPVGVLDAFNEAKPYAGPAAFRVFCGPTVPLARLPKLIYASDETLVANFEAAHFGPFPIPGIDPEWAIADVKGKVLTGGKLPRLIVPLGNTTPLGEIRISLANFRAPGRYTLAV